MMPSQTSIPSLMREGMTEPPKNSFMSLNLTLYFKRCYHPLPHKNQGLLTTHYYQKISYNDQMKSIEIIQQPTITHILARKNPQRSTITQGNLLTSYNDLLTIRKNSKKFKTTHFQTTASQKKFTTTLYYPNKPTTTHYYHENTRNNLLPLSKTYNNLLLSRKYQQRPPTIHKNSTTTHFYPVLLLAIVTSPNVLN